MPKTTAALALVLFALPALSAPAADTVDFARDVRPILSENCFACHGPDDAARKGKLRLDIADGAFKKHGEKAAIVPGKPDQSEALRRILTADSDDKMPPSDTGKKLTAAQVETLKKWIAQGATYTGHWAFEPIKSPAIPTARNPQSAIGNAIDAFLLARLDKDKLTFSPQASKETLLRRVTLDLTGLPPTIQELDAFLADTSADAYEKVVDRLLASPHYGERMALDWLDAARFADTHGFHIDAGRDMTRWREWVIDAFNANKPFDRFTVEQLAGDLLPSATLDQKVASGFNRNHMINFEGGAIPEEYHAAYLIDRVNTTATVWLGLTVACAQCHDHKYDPISQKDYYRLYAFFNNVPENGLDGRKGNAVPVVYTPTAAEQLALADADAKIAELEKQLDAPNPRADAAQVAWEKQLAAASPAWVAVGVGYVESKEKATLMSNGEGAVRHIKDPLDRDTYKLYFTPGLKRVTAIRLDAQLGLFKTVGRGDGGNFALSEIRVLTGDNKLLTPDKQEKAHKIKSATATAAAKDSPITAAFDGKDDTAWSVPADATKAVQSATFTLDKPITGADAQVVTVILDFQAKPKALLTEPKISFSAADNPSAGPPAEIHELAKKPAAERTPEEKATLRNYYRQNVSPEFKSIRDEIERAKKAKATAEKSVRTTMVMAEMPTPRDTFMLVRGQYDKKGDKVTAGTPAFLPPLATGNSQLATPTRLDLARWLVSKDNPLTARVIVNRYWQAYFGTGIVKTADDFGSQGEWPTHPELLDFLASRFVQSGWDVKAMQRLIVTSAAYKQSSKVTPDVLNKDPENRLLARGPRHRLPAEFIRDQALAVAGLLNKEIGGKSVSPYQPAGLWEELMSREDGKNWTAQTYVQSTGADLYRRTMYTFWKRTSPPAQLSTFDAPDRETCTVRRARTNTPLQALVLLNDPTYVEAARKLAERILDEPAAKTPEARLTHAVRLTLSRNPTPAELTLLKQALDRHTARYLAAPDQADKLLNVGESPAAADRHSKSDLAAWTMVSGVLLNLDETVTKP